MSKRFRCFMFLFVAMLSGLSACNRQEVPGFKEPGTSSVTLFTSSAAPPPETTTAAAAAEITSAAATAAEPGEPNPYDGEMAAIYDAAVGFAFAASKNVHMWHGTYSDLYPYLAWQENGAGQRTYDLPLVNFAKYNQVQRDYITYLLEKEQAGETQEFQTQYAVAGFSVENKQAKIELDESVFYKYGGHPLGTGTTNNYTLYFEKRGGAWLIYDIDLHYDAGYQAIKHTEFDEKAYLDGLLRYIDGMPN